MSIDEGCCPLCVLAFPTDMAMHDHLVLDHDDDTTWAATADGRIIITAYVMEEAPVDTDQLIDDVSMVAAVAVGFVVGLVGAGVFALRAARKLLGG
jgi:hypothetical protein